MGILTRLMQIWK